MSGPLMLLFELRFLFDLQAGGVDLFYLVSQQIELLRVGAFIDDQFGFAGVGLGVLPHQIRERDARALQGTVCVQNGQLPREVEKGLVIVRTMDIDEKFAQGGQRLQSGWRTVDELTVLSCGGEAAFDQ
jgi:hypothetical protein